MNLRQVVANEPFVPLSDLSGDQTVSTSESLRGDSLDPRWNRRQGRSYAPLDRRFLHKSARHA
jgi:hypothetical protein